MSLQVSNITVSEAKTKNKSKRFNVRLAENTDEIELCLRLRYRVFAQEMGAMLSTDRKASCRERV